MSNPDQNKPQADATEWTPEARAALGKARRSFAFSMGIMVLGFMAVGFALVYRVTRDSPPPAVADAVSIPAGAEIISALTDDGTVQVTYRLGGDVTLSIFDAGTGALTRSLRITAE
ncbi:DUF6476 family protein [Devosia chinhatensis]|uniref:Fimbrial protein n=1 Tax=Devosia chinhatensis TaxID=429727 RepID=A0A0F5FFT5_9HYPH|nr:DUF6476 family protein [Devosia chinhatensis]KKB07460.1 hypothetical protein VE26_11915 [Devosia chinhatensis]